ncbi:unnamed protein product [Hermetia illucens]|uniref:Daxx histone-binding domain-containing protein n=2 Tax=Hermetia illucens TaxID=343691 RepID=A0A7R8UQX8_HERIL|nr:unnamed protein product [Hermetia illucens]
MTSIIVLDSSEDESDAAAETIRKTAERKQTSDHNVYPELIKGSTLPGNSSPRYSKENIELKRKDENDIEKPRKRIKPTLVSKTINKGNFVGSITQIETGNNEVIYTAKRRQSDIAESTELHVDEHNFIQNLEGLDKLKKSENNENLLTPTFNALIEACKKADSSNDMNILIEKKLLKYYHSVHPDFVTSKGFCKTVKLVHEQIESKPELVYYQLRTVFEELKIRRKSNTAVMSNEDVSSTGNERRDRQIRLLSKGLLSLTKRIEKLEETDVDFGDEDNSAYLQLERLKKHACKIYDKICDLTGESRHAHRAVKKPVTFQGTCYPQFNKTLQAFVNRTETFPDFFDVLRCLEHCNTHYSFELRNDEMKKIAQDAFLKIGKLLQNRRKADLYETVAHFAGVSPDPALEDEELNAKLAENQKFHTKIGSIIDRYAKEQELSAKEYRTNDEKSVNMQDSHLADKENQNIECQGINKGRFKQTDKAVTEVESFISVINESKDESASLKIEEERTDNIAAEIDNLDEIIISDEDDS